MFTIYADDEILYSPMLIPGGTYDIIDAKITREPGKAGSFVFTIPPNHRLFGKLAKLKTLIKVVDTENVKELKNGALTEKKDQKEILPRVLYKHAAIVDGKIVLSIPFKTEMANQDEQCKNYNTYPYFYGDLESGEGNGAVYRYTKCKKIFYTGTIIVQSYEYAYYEIEAEVVQKEREVFFGRILNTTKDFYNRQRVTCEGCLTFLLDSIQRPYTHQGDISALLKKYIDSHNSQVETAKQFSLRNITVKDKNDYINRSSVKYPNTLDEIQEKLVKTHGGYLKVDRGDGKQHLDYLADPGEINSQTIEFGKNLLDMEEYITAENIFTVLVPLGAKIKDDQGNDTEERLTVSSVNNGNDYLENAEGIKLFGKIVKTHEWEDVTLAENLLKKGQEYLASAVEMSVSLKLKAVDLHLADIEVEAIKEGDSVRVISVPHGIDSYFMCTKTELDLLDPGKSVYEFGTKIATLTNELKDKM